MSEELICQKAFKQGKEYCCSNNLKICNDLCLKGDFYKICPDNTYRLLTK